MDIEVFLTELCGATGLDLCSSIKSLSADVIKLLKEGFVVELIPHYCQKLSHLKVLLKYQGSQKAGSGSVSLKKDDVQGSIKLQEKTVDEQIHDIFCDICRPFLTHIHPTSDTRESVLVLLGVVCELILACVKAGYQVLSLLVDTCIHSLEIYNTEKPTSSDTSFNNEMLDIYTVLEVLRFVLTKSISPDDVKNDRALLQRLKQVFTMVLQVIDLLKLELVSGLCVPVLVRILQLDGQAAADSLASVWTYIQSLPDNDRKQYILLCGFANFLFPVTGSAVGLDLRCDDAFWTVIQTGLSGTDTGNRKRSMYLLKRIVDICERAQVDVNLPFVDERLAKFWWSKDRASSLSKLWENFLLLVEVLEEKQVHVIKPLLPRVKVLVQASLVPAQGTPLIHTSWLSVIFARSSCHESMQVIRWGAENVLTLDFTQCPMLQQGQEQLLCGPLLTSLREPKLFPREAGTEVGSQPEVAKMLTRFFPNCWMALGNVDQQRSFLQKVLKGLSGQTWGPVPLMYICRALTFIPPTACLDRDTIKYIRDLLTGYLTTISSFIRGAVHCFCLQILTSLIDTTKVPPDEFLQILTLFRQDECLQRGTTLWRDCWSWLKQTSESGDSAWSGRSLCELIETSTVEFLKTSTESSFSTGDTVKAQQIARCLLIASDAAIATEQHKDSPSSLVRVTEMLASTLNAINTHAYMSTHRADKALQLLVCVVKELTFKGLQETSSDLVAQVIARCVEECQAELISYLSRQITEGVETCGDLGKLRLYLAAVEMLLQAAPVVPGANMEKLVARCIQVHTTAMKSGSDLRVKLHQLTSVCVLGTMSIRLCDTAQEPGTRLFGRYVEQISNYAKDMDLDLFFTKPVSQDDSSKVSQTEWGKCSSLFQQSQWYILQMALYQSATCRPPSELLDMCVEALSVSSGTTGVPVMCCIKQLIPQVVGEWTEDRMVGVVEACWSCTDENRNKLEYWPLLEAQIQAVFQSCLLSLTETSPVIRTLLQYGQQLISIGQEKTGTANILTTQLCTELVKPGMLEHSTKFFPLVESLCMFGNIHKKWDSSRQLLDVAASVEEWGTSCSVNELVKSVANEDIKVRTTVASFLCQLDPGNESHCRLATQLVSQLMETYTEILRHQTNNFSNTKSHRQKHRLIQIVLVLEKHILDTFRLKLWQFIWSSLEMESQPSVRHMMEWMAVLMATRLPGYGDKIWDLFEKYRETHNMVLCSLLCVVVQLGPYLQPDQQADYYSHAMTSILPWCMAHHFSTRIFAQTTMVRLWHQCEDQGLHTLLEKHKVLRAIVDFSEKNRNSTKNVKRLLESFFFKTLDFHRDYSLETIFCTLPRLTSLAEEEWIAPRLFKQCSIWKLGSSCVPLYNKTDDLKTNEHGFWKWKGGLSSPDDDTEEGAAGNGEGDVQKKIMPWRQMVPDEETSLEIDYGVKTGETGGLVVVTSLINKIPNLGGLCRSSEIFGVSEYVVGNLQYTNDKTFQSLSVTAQKWLPITEVSESRLPEYLLEKRQEGYTLVGVEQTANSVCLTDYNFPVKSLLLLGSEKEGIPVELIGLLDVCVEIPQQGVIRSLNVHVSGALLIWEYRRQQLMKNTS